MPNIVIFNSARQFTGPLAAEGKLDGNSVAAADKMPLITEPNRAGGDDSAAKPTRNVIVHYHFFKNAGTSIDEMLRENFGAVWRSYEEGAKPTELSQYIIQDPDITVVSSHKALFPVPEIEGVAIWPIFYLRHPIDRFLSIYEFERNQRALTDGAKIASTNSISEYLRWRMARSTDRTVCDFHVYRLSRGGAFRGRPTRSEELEEAKSFLDRAGFFGIVEHFEKSVDWLQRWLSPEFPTLKLRPVHANVTNVERASTEERIGLLKSRVGDQLFEDLLAANRADMELYSYASKLFAERI
jgi:hypothetical protein